MAHAGERRRLLSLLQKGGRPKQSGMQQPSISDIKVPSDLSPAPKGNTAQVEAPMSPSQQYGSAEHPSSGKAPSARSSIATTSPSSTIRERKAHPTNDSVLSNRSSFSFHESQNEQDLTGVPEEWRSRFITNRSEASASSPFFAFSPIRLTCLV